MKQQIPINTIGGVSRTIYAHYAQAGWHDFDPTSPIPHTAILEIEMKEPKPIQVAQIYDQEQNPINGRVYSEDGIAPTLRTPTGGLSEPKIAVSCALRGRNPENPSDRTAGINTEQRLELGGDVANCLTSVQKDSMVAETCILGYTRDNKGNVKNYHERDLAGTIHTSSGSGGNTDQFVKEPCGCYDNQFGEFAREPIEGVARTLKADHHNAVLLKYRIRKLTPRECFRLMGVDDADIDKLKSAKLMQTLKSGIVKEKPMPKTQLYKMAGNSIVVDVLYNIFYQMFIAEPPKPQPKQQSFDFGDF